MLPEIGMLDRVLIARLAILPVKALMGRNDRLFGWKVENIQSIIHDILNDCRLAAVLHLSVPFRYLSNMFAGLRRPSHYSFRSGPGLDPWTLQIITTEMDTLLSAKMGNLCLSQRLKWPKGGRSHFGPQSAAVYRQVVQETSSACGSAVVPARSAISSALTSAVISSKASAASDISSLPF